jgi:ribosome modulation factor
MTAFEQGYHDFLHGKSEEQNPYDKEKSPNSLKRWAEGWKKARATRRT